MEKIALFLIELSVLFLLSRFIQKKLSFVLYQTTKSLPITIHVLAFLFLPGTVVHELSHYLAARLLFVHTGKISLLPEREDDYVKLGSVEIGRTDPLRRILIGLSPFFTGTSLILFSLFVFESQNLWSTPFMSALLFYILFEIGNTMFSSKKDLEGATFLIVLIVVLTIFGYIAGVRISVEEISHALSPTFISTISKGCYYLLFPIGANLALLLFLYTVSSFFKKAS